MMKTSQQSGCQRAGYQQASAEEYDNIWEGKWGDLQKYGPTSRHTRRIIANMLAPLKFDSILDVGCGEGSLLAFLHDRFHCSRIAGMDLSDTALARAKRNFPQAEYFTGGIESLKTDRPFDVV